MNSFHEFITCEATLKTLREVCTAFRIPGELTAASLITRGNINTTYKVDFFNPAVEGRERNKSYLVQEVNAYVFKNPKQIMQNIDKVTTHIRNRCPGQLQLHFHHTATGKNYYFGKKGAFWRLSNYIQSLTFDSCGSLDVLRGCGKAFGLFQHNLSDFDASQLYETIPNFHNTARRMEKFFATVKEDPFELCGEVEEEIAAVADLREQASLLSLRLAEGKLPLRTTHNDTKVNNVLFSRETLEPIAVIDLDTVMPGLAMYDFGDAVRFAASNAAEDEKDLSKVFLDLEKFRAIAEGFVGAAGEILQPCEIETMALGALTLTVELGMRFLEDYITGDPYFRTRYPGHNLDRARCQLTLAKDIRRKLDEMNGIVYSIAGK